ncbi:SgcJ/EcaC family oxidoreductase [Kribbella monticola]|uniref:SgcJ/EcaC family oxidoreductase n=1 Tax=Kribbella monticola TaxID=2185285 RepID=UPI000DD3EBDC|nr:SgcJ/EcaC family oxidoreductase [Kribbella monticola]
MIDTRVETEIRQMLDRLADSWNRGDATAYGEHFTADASYVTFGGTVYRGRDDLVAGHAALFGKFLKDTQMFSELVELRLYGEDTAIAVTRGDVGKRRPRRLSKVQTFTLIREADGHWRVAAFHNTKHAHLMEAISFRLLPTSAPRRR